MDNTDEIDISKVVVGADGAIAVVEPEQIIPQTETPVDVSVLEQLLEATTARKDELMKQSAVLITEVGNVTQKETQIKMVLAQVQKALPVDVMARV